MFITSAQTWWRLWHSKKQDMTISAAQNKQILVILAVLVFLAGCPRSVEEDGQASNTTSLAVRAKINPGGERVMEKTMIESLSTLAEKIREAPDFMPSFRSEVPLGLTDDMLSLVNFGPVAMPTLRSFLDAPNPRLRKAAVVMLAHIDTEEAEELVVAAVEDKQVRAEAILCLGNMFMRNPNSAYAYEDCFLRDPQRGLEAVLEYIDDESTVTINSGFKVYEGPLADLAIGVAVRIAGPKRFTEDFDLNDHLLIGLTPYTFVPALKEKLRQRFIKHDGVLSEKN